MHKTCILCILCILCSTVLAQNLQWVYNDLSPTGDAQYGAQSVTVGADGNIYAAGAVNFGIPRNEDFTVESFDTLGNRRWRYLYQGPGGNAEYADDICYGEDGNIYACGLSHGGVPNYWDFTVASLTSSGTQRWVNVISNSAGSPPDDEAYSICYGGDGNIYACGRYGVTAQPGNNLDAIVVSYNSTTGAERWRYTYDGPSHSVDYAFKVIYGGDGNIYIAGRTSVPQGMDLSADFLVISLTPSGVQRWVYVYNDPVDGWDNACDISWGNDGNIYAFGTTYQNDLVGDITVISLTSNGAQRWLYHYDGPSQYRDIGIKGIAGRDGNIYVVGYSRSTTYDDAVLISITADGTERWVYSYNNPATNSREWFTCITQGPNNDIYTAGYGYFGAANWLYGDILVASVSMFGQERWVYRYNGPIPNPGEDYASAVTYGNNSVYVAGRSATDPSGYGRSFFVMSLKDTTLGVEELTSYTKNPRSLKAMPNPFVNSTTIFGNRGKDLLIFDITGHQVAKEKGSRIGLNLPPGIYFLQSENNDKELIKVVKTK
jgi:hypothetical protein